MKMAAGQRRAETKAATAGGQQQALK